MLGIVFFAEFRIQNSESRMVMLDMKIVNRYVAIIIQILTSVFLIEKLIFDTRYPTEIPSRNYPIGSRRKKHALAAKPKVERYTPIHSDGCS